MSERKNEEDSVNRSKSSGERQIREEMCEEMKCESDRASFASEIKISFIGLGQTPTLCALLSPPPLCSLLLAFVALLSLPLSLLPCFSILLMWTKWKGNRLVQGCDLVLLTPTHSTVLRGSQQSEKHAGALMQTSHTPSQYWREGKQTTAALLRPRTVNLLRPTEVLTGRSESLEEPQGEVNFTLNSILLE